MGTAGVSDQPDRQGGDLQRGDDPYDERNFTGQPRPNVMFEAGRAFGTHPDRTILVHIGKLRRVSDLAGLNVVKIDGTPAPLLALADRLARAGCPIDGKDPDVFDPARFASLPTHDRTAAGLKMPEPSDAEGSRVPASSESSAPGPQLSLKLVDRGNQGYLLEVVNEGGSALEHVQWELPEEVVNWKILADVLPEYPIPRLGPQQSVRVPVAISMGAHAYVDLTVRARTEAGEPYATTDQLSLYG